MILRQQKQDYPSCQAATVNPFLSDTFKANSEQVSASPITLFC